MKKVSVDALLPIIRPGQYTFKRAYCHLLKFYCLLFSKQMGIVMTAPGKMERRTAMESSITWAEGSCTRAFGWMGQQNVAPCPILKEMKHPVQPNIRFHR